MTKLFSIVFSTLFLIQSTNIHFDDIIKIRELLEHANFHKNEYGDNLAVFLSKHYGDLKESHKEQHQKEQKNHKHLPVQQNTKAQVHIDIVINKFDFSFKILQVIKNRKTNFYYQDKFSTFEKRKIFQPPRFV